MKKIWMYILSHAIGFFVCFAVMYWIFHSDFNKSINASIGAIIGMLVAEYLLYILFSWYQKTISKKRITNDVSN
jgi:uncharacterized protein YqgC (DUF456 family)